MKKLKLEVSAVTDAGTVREVNEDAYLCKIIDAKEFYAGIFAVADGVGGLQRGEIASLTAIANVNKWWETDFRKHYRNQETVMKSFVDMMRVTNQELLHFGEKNQIKLATTLSALLIYKDQAVIFHTGDSRIYRFRKGAFYKLEQMTEDHSCLVMKNINGRVLPKWVLTDCLGNQEDFRCFTNVSEIRKNDIFLIVSDGIYKTMETNQLSGFMKENKKSPGEMCSLLVDRVKQNGERDNISVIVLRVFE